MPAGGGCGSLQSWAGGIITILREARQAVEAARARGDTALDPQLLEGLRERYDTAVYLESATAHGITALDAIRDAITGKPWLPPLPHSADTSSRPP